MYPTRLKMSRAMLIASPSSGLSTSSWSKSVKDRSFSVHQTLEQSKDIYEKLTENGTYVDGCAETHSFQMEIIRIVALREIGAVSMDKVEKPLTRFIGQRRERARLCGSRASFVRRHD